MANYDYYDNAFWGNLGESSGDVISSGLFGGVGDVGPNILNASITGLFSALGTLGATLSTRKLMNYYKRQEGLYIENANEQARRIQLKGDIALRNLQIRHAMSQGKSELAVAAGGGNLSGSNLDKLVNNYKYDAMDERTSSIQTLWEKSNVQRDGYIRSIQMASQAQTLAYKNRTNALAALGKYMSTSISALLKDKQFAMAQNADAIKAYYEHTDTIEATNKYYNTPEKKAAGIIYSTSADTPEVDSNFDANEFLQSLQFNNSYTDEESPSILPIWVNEDGSPGIMPLGILQNTTQ